MRDISLTLYGLQNFGSQNSRYKDKALDVSHVTIFGDLKLSLLYKSSYFIDDEEVGHPSNDSMKQFQAKIELLQQQQKYQ